MFVEKSRQLMTSDHLRENVLYVQSLKARFTKYLEMCIIERSIASLS